MVVVSMFLLGCQGNVAGEAYRKFGDVKAPVKEPAGTTVCTEGKTCGFLTKSDLAGLTPVFSDPYVLSSYYGLPAGMLPKDKTGNDFCKDLGYAGCLAAQIDVRETIHNTSDGTCAPNPPESERYYYLGECTSTAFTTTCYPGSLDSSLLTPPSPVSLASKYPGKDSSVSRRIDAVFCLK